MMALTSRSTPSRQRGLSIVELMVGVAVGLFIVAGATKLTVDSLGSNRRLLMETRLNQDMRAAADIIARDLRRASYWEASMSGLWSAGAPVVSAVNPYAAITTTANASVAYQYERTGIAAGAEPLGFRVQTDANGRGVIEVQNPVNGWQPISDATAMSVTGFTLTPTERVVELWNFCSCRTRVPVSAACQDATLAASATRPQMRIRQFDLRIQAQSVTDAAVRRELRETVRVRNDELKNPNGCPSS